jgi:protein SEY1
LARETNRLDHKQYQIVSIIGSQSSGKSTLLNALFTTDFEVLNRKQRVGQTTKGIWFSVETPSNIIILDVEGSDSNEREERTVISTPLRR